MGAGMGGGQGATEGQEGAAPAGGRVVLTGPQQGYTGQGAVLQVAKL
jgi:hypothetical protein